MFLTYRFNSFNFVTATIFSRSSVILLITPFTEFFSCNFDTYRFISPKNLKISILESFGLHQKNLKLYFLNMASLSNHHLSQNFNDFLRQLQ